MTSSREDDIKIDSSPNTRGEWGGENGHPTHHSESVRVAVATLDEPHPRSEQGCRHEDGDHDTHARDRRTDDPGQHDQYTSEREPADPLPVVVPVRLDQVWVLRKRELSPVVAVHVVGVVMHIEPLQSEKLSI